MLNEFSRTETLIGKIALNKLSNSKIAIFGIGGVGSFAVEALARSGIGKFVLIDHDIICITNINRQLHATHKTIGKPKVEIMKDRILEINENAEVIIYQDFYLPNNSDNLMSDNYDYIIDAIDTVTAKIDLIVQATKRNIPIISCMGAGNKLDPTKFEIDDIYNTSVCPLAKVMRKELKKHGITSLKVVYSKENPIKIIKNTEYNDNYILEEESNLKNMRKHQVPGSISFVPSVAGLIIAGEVIKNLINIK